jgi:hypothetical protein
MPNAAKLRLLFITLLCAFSAVSWAGDKGRPSTDVIAENASKECKDTDTGQTGLNKAILAGGPDDIVLATSWNWAGSGFDTVKPVIPLQPNQAYIFHVTTWNVTEKDVTLKASSWYVYRVKAGRMEQRYTQSATENLPLLYGERSLVLISVQRLENVDAKRVPARTVSTNYKLTVKQKTAQNVTNLVAVGAALLGVKTGPFTALVAPSNRVPVCVEPFSIHGGHPPYDLTAEASFTFPDPSKPAGGTARKAPTDTKKEEVSQSQQGGTEYAASGEGSPDGAKKQDEAPKDDSKPVSGVGAPPTTGCCTCNCCNCGSAGAALPPKPGDTQKKDSGSSISRTFSVLDKEYWDINLGLNIPSVNQPSFMLSKDNVVQRSISKKVSPYAFVSIYPFAAFSPKDGNWPHLNLGLPVAGQPLHRPFGGVAEKIPWVDRYTGIPISVFGGTVALKESISTLPIGPTTTPTQFALRSHWVWKGMFGLEFPVSALISKIGKK